MSSYHLLEKRAAYEGSLGQQAFGALRTHAFRNAPGGDPYAGYDRPMGSYNGTFQMPRGSSGQLDRQAVTGGGGIGYGTHYGPPTYNPYRNVNPAQPQPPAQPDWKSAPGAAAPKDTSGSWFQKNVVDNPWLEGAAGLATAIPVIGGAINGVWQGGRAAYHASQGNYGKAGEAAAWGALGFVPGGGIARGAKLGMGGVKALRAGSTFGKGVQAVRAAAPIARAPGFAGAMKATGKQLGGTAVDVAAAAGVGAALPNYGPGSEHAAAGAAAATPPVTDLSSYGANMLSQGIAANKARQQ